MQDGMFDRPRIQQELDEEEQRLSRIVQAGLEEGWDVAEFAVILGVTRPEVGTLIKRYARKEAPLPLG